MSMQSDGFGPNPNDPPPKSTGSSSALKWVLGILAGLALVTVVCCGGIFLLVRSSMGVVGTQVADQVRNDPVIVEHIGSPDSVSASMDIMGTGEYAEATGESGVVVFSVDGDKGSGSLRARQARGNQPFSGFVLEKDGQEYPLSE